MAVPKRKVSKSRRNMRRAHDRLRPVNLTECSNCGSKKLPHHICDSCGFYDGRQVFQKVEAQLEA
jgi:large subunit ribosomal protein L32